MSCYNIPWYEISQIFQKNGLSPVLALAPSIMGLVERRPECVANEQQMLVADPDGIHVVQAPPNPVFKCHMKMKWFGLTETKIISLPWEIYEKW